MIFDVKIAWPLQNVNDVLAEGFLFHKLFVYFPSLSEYTLTCHDLVVILHLFWSHISFICQVLNILNIAISKDLKDAHDVGSARLRSKVLELYGRLTSKVHICV